MENPSTWYVSVHLSGRRIHFFSGDVTGYFGQLSTETSVTVTVGR